MVKCPLSLSIAGKKCSSGDMTLGQLGDHMKTQHLKCPNNCAESTGYFKSSALQQHLEEDCQEQLLVCADCYNA
jgi:hypothetical protein